MGNYLISGEEVNIEWQIYDLIENHGSGCAYFALSGKGDNGKNYQATGIYQGDELEEVEDIEEV